MIATSAAVGPSLAAALLAAGSWPWLFLVNLPLGLASLLIGSALLPRSRAPSARFDVVAAILSAIAFAALFICVAGLIGNLPITWSALALPAGVATIFLLACRSWDSHPLVPVDLIRIPRLRQAYLGSICAFAAQGLVLVSLPFVLHRIGFDIVATGGMITPLPVGVGLGSLLAGRLLDRWQGVKIATIGLALATTGLLVLVAAVALNALPLAIAIAMAGFGVGFGLFQTSNNQAMLTGASLVRAGAASSMLSLVRILGQMSGALVAALSLTRFGSASPISLLCAAALTAAAMGVMLRRRRIGPI